MRANCLSWIVSGVVCILMIGCAASTPTFAPTIARSPTANSASSPTPSAAASPTTAPPTNTTASTPSAAPSATKAASPTIAAPSNTAPPTALPRTLVPTTTSAPTGNSADWTTYHRDNLRTGYVPNMPDPQQLTVAWNTPLDGAVYAEPLVVGGHLIVATEGGTIYSLNAGTGQIEWHTNVGTPASRSELPCGNISPLGITGTPVYDPASGLVFAVAEITGPSHLLVGTDVRTGEVKLRRSADIADMEPAPHQQRAALAVSQGMVYIAYGGLFGDCGTYRGTVIAARTDGSGDLLAYRVPTSREAGIWAAAGPALDAAGRVYVSVGNGAETNGDWDHSDSVLRLAPTLQLEDGFAPQEWQQDNAADADLGSMGPVLLPDNLVFIAGKSGTGYLLNADALGGVGGQLQAAEACHAYGGAATVGSVAFIPCNEGVQQIIVSGGKFALGWRAEQAPGSPVVGGHTVYSVDRRGNLYALDMDTGKVRASVQVGSASRFATPALYQNFVFIGTLSGVTAVTVQ